jgi:hypothetical protein
MVVVPRPRNPMTVNMGVDGARGVMVVVVVAQMRVHERRRQRTRLQCNREPEGEKTPTHGRDSTGRSCC